MEIYDVVDGGEGLVFADNTLTVHIPRSWSINSVTVSNPFDCLPIKFIEFSDSSRQPFEIKKDVPIKGD